MRKIKYVAFFVCLIFIITLIAACGQMERPENQDNIRNNRNNTEGQQTRLLPRTVSPRRVVPSPAPGNNGTNINTNLRNRDRQNVGNNRDYTERVENIAERAAQLKEIESATCIITGDTALIGVQFDEQYKGGVTNRIKQKVEDVCREKDPEIGRVVVTADPDVFSRIEDMLKDIGEGRPVSGFAEEINELVNRLQPK